MFKYFTTILSLLFIFLFTGCTPNVQMDTPQNNLNAKKFIADKNFANLYIYRNETFGYLVSMPISIDDKTIGTTKAKSFFNLKLTPGNHTIKSFAENTSIVNLNFEANKNYFIWQEVKMGIMKARTQLNIVNQIDGEKGVMECEKIKSHFEIIR